MKQSLVRCGLAAALLLVTASEARADPPDISSIGTRTPVFNAAAGTTGFNVTFLFGKAGNTNTLLYSVGGGMWEQIYVLTGNAPDPTVSPAPGTNVNFSFAPLAAETEIIFALCQGSIAGGADLSACVGEGPFFTGLAATNVISLTASQWNAARGSFGVDAMVGQTVFAYEDLDLSNPSNDEDFNDLVFSTSLQARAVPEPASLALVMAGMFGMAGFAARRRERSV